MRGSVRGIHFIGCLFFMACCSLFGNTPSPGAANIHHLAPTHWYTGFKDSLLEIIVNAENIDLNDIEMEPYSGVRFLGKTNSGNRHIAYLNLIISQNAKPGFLEFHAKPTVKRLRYVRPFRFTFELKARQKTAFPQINQSDIIYRILVDRFANGDEGNDNVSMKYRSRIDRSDPEARHGGDIRGLLDHADYLKSLGVTSIWMNSVQESDHPELSELGFSISDHYSIDPRFGSSDQMMKLGAELNRRGQKLMMDINPNNLSTSHWLYQNFDTGWFNGWDTLLHPDFTSYSINDPYYSPGERNRAMNSWIDRNSPDLNHVNPHVRRYMLQVFYWWIENYRLSGICINKVAFFSNIFLEYLIGEIRHEFPGIFITTDTKTNSAAAQASMVKNYIRGFEGNQLESIPDYHTHRVLRRLLDTNENLTRTVSELYMALSDDILYLNPARNLTFIDNSIESRSIQQAGFDTKRWNMTGALMLMLRGIPVIYYGTEVGLASPFEGALAALVDFPGGWKGDKVNDFNQKNRPAEAEKSFQYFQKLIQIRTGNPVITTGEMMQYPVEKGIYVFFKYNRSTSVMVITNTNTEASRVDFNRFSERTKNFKSWTNLLSSETGFIEEPLTVPAGECIILKLY